MMCGIIIFVTVMLLRQLVGRIPVSVIAGIVFYVGITLFDRRTLNLLKNAPKAFRNSKGKVVDLIVTLVVAIITIRVNLIAAVGSGVLIASTLFISRLGKTVIKRKYFGEMAFLDGSTRSAGVWANEDSEILRLSFENFQALQSEGPLIANELLLNIARELSKRLRRTSNQVRLLEQS